MNSHSIFLERLEKIEQLDSGSTERRARLNELYGEVKKMDGSEPLVAIIFAKIYENYRTGNGRTRAIEYYVQAAKYPTLEGQYAHKALHNLYDKQKANKQLSSTVPNSLPSSNLHSDSKHLRSKSLDIPNKGVDFYKLFQLHQHNEYLKESIKDLNLSAPAPRLIMEYTDSTVPKPLRTSTQDYEVLDEIDKLIHDSLTHEKFKETKDVLSTCYDEDLVQTLFQAYSLSLGMDMNVSWKLRKLIEDIKNNPIHGGPHNSSFIKQANTYLNHVEKATLATNMSRCLNDFDEEDTTYIREKFENGLPCDYTKDDGRWTLKFLKYVHDLYRDGIPVWIETINRRLQPPVPIKPSQIKAEMISAIFLYQKLIFNDKYTHYQSNPTAVKCLAFLSAVIDTANAKPDRSRLIDHFHAAIVDKFNDFERYPSKASEGLNFYPNMLRDNLNDQLDYRNFMMKEKKRIDRRNALRKFRTLYISFPRPAVAKPDCIFDQTAAALTTMKKNPSTENIHDDIRSAMQTNKWVALVDIPYGLPTEPKRILQYALLNIAKEINQDDVMAKYHPAKNYVNIRGIVTTQHRSLIKPNDLYYNYDCGPSLEFNPLTNPQDFWNMFEFVKKVFAIVNQISSMLAGTFNSNDITTLSAKNLIIRFNKMLNFVRFAGVATFFLDKPNVTRELLDIYDLAAEAKELKDGGRLARDLTRLKNSNNPCKQEEPETLNNIRTYAEWRRQRFFLFEQMRAMRSMDNALYQSLLSKDQRNELRRLDQLLEEETKKLVEDNRHYLSQIDNDADVPVDFKDQKKGEDIKHNSMVGVRARFFSEAAAIAKHSSVFSSPVPANVAQTPIPVPNVAAVVSNDNVSALDTNDMDNNGLSTQDTDDGIIVNRDRTNNVRP